MRCSRMLLPLALTPMLGSCGATTGPRTASTPIPPLLSTPAPTPTSATEAQGAATARDPLCSAVRIVQLSRVDTTGTKEQVEANNAVLTRICGAS